MAGELSGRRNPGKAVGALRQRPTILHNLKIFQQNAVRCEGKMWRLSLYLLGTAALPWTGESLDWEGARRAGMHPAVEDRQELAINAPLPRIRQARHPSRGRTCAAPTAQVRRRRKEVTYQKQQEEAQVRTSLGHGGKAGVSAHHTLEFAPARVERSGATTLVSLRPRSLLLASAESGCGEKRLRRAQRRRMISAVVYPTSPAARRESTPTWPDNHR